MNVVVWVDRAWGGIKRFKETNTEQGRPEPQQAS